MAFPFLRKGPVEAFSRENAHSCPSRNLLVGTVKLVPAHIVRNPHLA